MKLANPEMQGTIISLAPLGRLLAAERDIVRPTGDRMDPDSDSNPDPDPDSVTDEASFLAFVRALEADRRLAATLEEQDPQDYDAPRGWQNNTIEQFLESALAWAEDSHFGRRQDLGEAVSPWRRLAVFLYCGKIYE